ncbi:hypothetical protein HPE56_17145 [Maribacter sp. ANRC-HE7]|uniref:Uncharacterized protein n=1 Tax=Maribacter aquimaris TaxID=2737171 RepID=A0ABR7V562_9FLAO|nr:hypothetical protein [Maribacter aquimaris]MBD0779530.1 hypothetical protein [Maribacter aquimaris]
MHGLRSRLRSTGQSLINKTLAENLKQPKIQYPMQLIPYILKHTQLPEKGVRNTVGLFQAGPVLEMIDFKTQCPVERSRDLV